MPDDVPNHIRCILSLCREARERAKASSRSSEAEASAISQDIASLPGDKALSTPPVVVLLPDEDAARALRRRLQQAARADAGTENDGGGPVEREAVEMAERVWCTSLIGLAGNVARTHPAMENSTRIERATEAGIVRDALSSIPDGIWADLTGTSQNAEPESEELVRRLTRQVRELREHDVSPATLYALSPGKELTAAQRVLAIAYEAYDRYLLESSEHDAADLCGWATSQVRTRRAPWIESATFVVYDHIELSDGAASLLRALRDRVHRFVQLGPGASRSGASVRGASVPDAPSTGSSQASDPSLADASPRRQAAAPPETVASKLSLPDRLPSLSSLLGDEREAPVSDGVAPEETLLNDVVARARSSEDGYELSWIAAEDHRNVCSILREIQRMGWPASEVEVAVPDVSLARTAYDCEGEDVSVTEQEMQWVSYDAAGFSARTLLVVLAMPIASKPGCNESGGSAAFLSPSLRDRIASMTGTALPAPFQERENDAWRIGHMLWRHGGEAVIITNGFTSALSRSLRHLLEPYTFERDELRI